MEKKTIEERAEAFASVYPENIQHFVEECFIAGAESQIKESSDLLSERIKDYHFSQDMLINKAIDWLNTNWREYFDTDADGMIRFSGWKNDFIKAMKVGGDS